MTLGGPVYSKVSRGIYIQYIGTNMMYILTLILHQYPTKLGIIRQLIKSFRPSTSFLTCSNHNSHGYVFQSPSHPRYLTLLSGPPASISSKLHIRVSLLCLVNSSSLLSPRCATYSWPTSSVSIAWLIDPGSDIGILDDAPKGDNGGRAVDPTRWPTRRGGIVANGSVVTNTLPSTPGAETFCLPCTECSSYIG